uniref:Uncharacterized protein n=2 Tax=Aegilops tauschii subsp. strangulata TaxID=200361 RepID=A0A452Z3A6_AEGTS
MFKGGAERAGDTKHILLLKPYHCCAKALTCTSFSGQMARGYNLFPPINTCTNFRRACNDSFGNHMSFVNIVTRLVALYSFRPKISVSTLVQLIRSIMHCGISLLHLLIIGVVVSSIAFKLQPRRYDLLGSCKYLLLVSWNASVRYDLVLFYL